MGKIVLLDDLTINQIAAGEVIERPSSVVKEMVENSIDAGAKNITIEIEKGGISLIRITDDGSGIVADDMEIAFERHATSKIRKAEDLELVKTMGFRGEALASVAAISRVEMVSRTEGEQLGHKIVIEGGKTLETKEVATQKGTRITVQNLFYNTPVRYKFLKKDYTEAGYVETVVTRIALINRDVAIKLISNGKVLLQTNGSGDFKNIIYSIYGKDVVNGIIDVDYTYEDMKVTGVIGTPDIARSNKSNQMFFVNNRYIKDFKLSTAAEQAYREVLPSGKYAFLILNITVDSKKVDVNVHPAKLEVRFEEEAEVFRAVYNAIKASLATITIKPKMQIDFEKQENIVSERIAVPIETATIEAVKAISAEPVNASVIEEVKNEPLDVTPVHTENIEPQTSKSKIAEILKKFKKDDEIEKNEETTKVEETMAEEPSIYPTLREQNIEEPEKNETPNVEEIVVAPKVQIIEQSVLEKSDMPIQEEVNFEGTAVEAKLETPAVTNEDIIEKEVELGNTKISSNTRELDFDITSALKEATQALDSTKKIEIQDTQIIPSTRETVSQETQTVDLSKELKQGSKENEDNKFDTTEVNTEEVATKNEDDTIEDTVPSVEAVENITSKILELKMNNIDNTQMIDTAKVREALNDVTEITPEFANMYKKTFGVDANIIRKEREIEEKEREKINVAKDFVNAENDNLFENEEVIPARVNYNLIGIAFDTNIIIELNNEMYIIDQNAAFERLTYEAIKENYFNQEIKDSQNLLLPDIVTVTYREMSIARENVELFNNAGFMFEEFGENTLKLTAVPSLCEDLNTKQLFINVLNEIDRVALNEKEEKEEKFIVAVAKNATTRINRALDEREIDELLQRLLTLENPFDTEHGSITAIKMSRADIEKKFSRRK